MIGALPGPWLLCAALLCVVVAIRRGPRPPSGELWLVAAIVAGAAALRLAYGLWGPVHVNGQGPLWIRGALDPEPLAGYGPGYFELFSWATQLGAAIFRLGPVQTLLGTKVGPDVALFAANALLSALSPALLYAAVRFAGVERGGALAAAVVLAVDAVTVRMAASEGYVSSLVALVLAVQASLALSVRLERRGDRMAGMLALGAAGLIAAAAARIHPIGYLSLALCPLVVFGAEQTEGWQTRLVRTATAAALIAATVIVTSADSILATLQGSQVAGHAFTDLAPADTKLLLALFVMIAGLQRWLQLPWLPLLGVVSLGLMLATQDNFQEHPLQKLGYQRVFFPGLLLAAAALLPRRTQGSIWALASAAVVVAALLLPALPHLDKPTTEQLEYRFLQEELRDMPPGCTVAAVSRAGKRIWEIPSYLVPPRGTQGAGTQRTVERPSDLDVGAPGECLVYIRASLCTSVEARALCEAVEHEARLDRVASRVFPAAPSYIDLPYDRTEVEVVVFRANGSGVANQPVQVVGDGAAITPELAQVVYDRLSALRESDGCQLMRLDTSRFRMTVELQGRSGMSHTLEIATAPHRGGGGRRAGSWALALSADLEPDCSATLASIERVLEEIRSPQRRAQASVQDLAAGAGIATYANQPILVSSLLLLVLGTLRILYREARVQRPSMSAVLALVVVSGAALALRLSLSPRTFLHEYYHIAETVSAYQTGAMAPIYGNTGPALFRFVGAVLGRSEDVQVIFLTNAVIASLAIPAVALLDLALLHSWPRALCTAVLLSVLPQHLRFSAAEDLFVQALTFGTWALAIFALYVRTRRLDDALLAVLALSLAMQTRPEMLCFPAVFVALVLLVEPRSWRVLFAWRTLLALSVLAALLIPRLFELHGVLQTGSSPAAVLPGLRSYVDNLVFLWREVTPAVYWLLLVVGLVWGAWRAPGIYVWLTCVFLGYTLFPLSLFDNPPYNLRSQILPNSFLVLVAAGVAPLWMKVWGRSRLALAAGACMLVGFGAVVVVTSRTFVTELRDQQLEWAFLERTVPGLPAQATLLAAVEVGGRNLDGFPQFLLSRAGRVYDMVDARRAAAGETNWPAPAPDLLFYQGMYCFFAFDDEPSPDPMTAPCRAVHERYVAEPLLVEDLHTQGYSMLRYAGDGQRPFRIGFFRLTALR